MVNTRTLQRSFSGGELSPEMLGQLADAKYQSGLALCRNFIARPQGPVENRAGFAFVSEVKDSSKRTRLIPFTYSTTQTMVIEIGAGYFRFHTLGQNLMSGGAVYEVANPYAEADIFDIHYVQSADVLTLVHPNYPPAELRRTSATVWVYTAINFTPLVTAPSGLSVSTSGLTTTTTSTANGGSVTSVTSSAMYDYYYVVTALSADSLTESAPSSPVSVSSNLFVTGCTNQITWSGASTTTYNVYKRAGGVYGYIGQTTGGSFTDDNIAPDMSKTPPNYDTTYAPSTGTGTLRTYTPMTAGNYPGAVSYHEQRRVFAGSINAPQNIWMTKSGTESNMSYSLPTVANDRIAFRVAAREANTIRHIVPLTQLILLTSAAEWQVSSGSQDAITPLSIAVKPQSYIGASNVQPSIINNTMIYCAARGGHVRELAYNWQANGFITGDLSLRANHLFDNLSLVDMAYAKAPQPIVWFVSSNGKLLGLTYVPEQQIGAWHQHDTTNGFFESCCVVAEGAEDVLYVVVRRVINGTSKRYVERMATRAVYDSPPVVPVVVAEDPTVTPSYPEGYSTTQPSQADAFIVDCGASFTSVLGSFVSLVPGDTSNMHIPSSSSTGATTITGLNWLEGQTVSVLADGAVHPQCVVTGGTITLQRPAYFVQVGLPITSQLQTLPVVLPQDPSAGQGHAKNVNKVWLRVYRSGGIFVGPSIDELTEVKQRREEAMGLPPALKSEEVDVYISPAWQQDGTVCIEQKDPLPLTVINLTLEVAIGG